jgi:hypothetical protein
MGGLAGACPNFDPSTYYNEALGMMILSASFHVALSVQNVTGLPLLPTPPRAFSLDIL